MTCNVPYLHYCTASTEWRCHEERRLREETYREVLIGGAGWLPSTILKRTPCYRDLRESPYYQKDSRTLPFNSRKARKAHRIIKFIARLPKADIIDGFRNISQKDSGKPGRAHPYRRWCTLLKTTRQGSKALGSSGLSPKELEVAQILSTLKTPYEVGKGNGTCGTATQSKWQSIGICTTTCEDATDQSEQRSWWWPY